MTYELCKQLKDAGFPQIETNPLIVPSNAIWHPDDSYFVADALRLPTSSQLIEALGNVCITIQRHDDRYYAWLHEGSPHYAGSSSEEALAKLWLVKHTESIKKPNSQA